MFILFSESLYPHTIFGVSLNDCLEQERTSRSHLKVPTEAQYVPKSPRGRSSFSSYIEVPKDPNEVFTVYLKKNTYFLIYVSKYYFKCREIQLN